MKRSEMLAIIRDAFDDCLDIPTSSYIIIDDYAEYILSKIEDEGMLPPFNLKDSYHPDYPLDAQTWEQE